VRVDVTALGKSRTEQFRCSAAITTVKKVPLINDGMKSFNPGMGESFYK